MMAAESAETMLEVKDLLSKLKMQGAAGDSAAEFGAVLSNTTAASKKTDDHSSMFCLSILGQFILGIFFWI